MQERFSIAGLKMEGTAWQGMQASSRSLANSQQGNGPLVREPQGTEVNQQSE